MWPIELIEEHQINQVTIISATTYSGTFFAQRMCDLFATKISRTNLKNDPEERHFRIH